jgi:hypothetical protein
MPARDYSLATPWWTTPQGNLTLQDDSGDMMLSVPIAFLRGGHAAAFDYIHAVLAMTFSGCVNLTSLNGTIKGRAELVEAETLAVSSGGEYSMLDRR